MSITVIVGWAKRVYGDADHTIDLESFSEFMWKLREGIRDYILPCNSNSLPSVFRYYHEITAPNSRKLALAASAVARAAWVQGTSIQFYKLLNLALRQVGLGYAQQYPVAPPFVQEHARRLVYAISLYGEASQYIHAEDSDQAINTTITDLLTQPQDGESDDEDGPRDVDLWSGRSRLALHDFNVLAHLGQSEQFRLQSLMAATDDKSIAENFANGVHETGHQSTKPAMLHIVIGVGTESAELPPGLVDPENDNEDEVLFLPGCLFEVVERSTVLPGDAFDTIKIRFIGGPVIPEYGPRPGPPVHLVNMARRCRGCGGLLRAHPLVHMGMDAGSRQSSPSSRNR
ncbi:MAG: hypothetical protein EB075_12640 [Bacteroidetes bacterium]|nr:hypothetical protein [Bacteroidota bacterium]